MSAASEYRTNTKEWKIKRMEIIYRDTNQCQKCYRRGTNLKVHHIIPMTYYIYYNLQPPDDFPENLNVPDNLITLCNECHWEEHTGAWQKKFSPSSKSLDTNLDIILKVYKTHRLPMM